MTRFEYNNTVRDLLGVTTNPASALPGEEVGSGFGNDADALGVSRLLIDGYRSVAHDIAVEVTQNPTQLSRVTGCDANIGQAAEETACEQRFLTTYLPRAFRRPLTAEESSSYQATFTRGQQLGGTFADGVRAVIERSLQAAQFLYRVEVGEPLDLERGLAKPTPYEMATRLSYFVWGSAPDPELMDAAAQGTLDSKEGVLQAARRLLDDDRAKDSLRYFHNRLFEISGLDYLERDAGMYPTFQPGMGSLFRRETEHFLDHVIWEEGGDLATVFAAPYTFANETLASFYGLAPVSGEGFQKVNTDPTRRAGLLTHASILAVTTPGSRTDPVVRGHWLFGKVLCGKVPDPPLDVPMLPEPQPGQSVRERLAEHRDNDACRGCHLLMDPLGFAFENYDGVGLWRETDNGVAIDNSGAIPISDVAGPVNGAVEVGQKLAQSKDVRACYVRRYLTYAYGRALDATDDCSRSSAELAFEQAGGNIKELMLAVTQTDGFLSRALTAPEQ